MYADSEDGKKVAENNAKYANALAARPANAGNYVNNESQTLELLRKTREVQSWASERKDASCQSSRWDIADCVAGLHEVRGEGCCSWLA